MMIEVLEIKQEDDINDDDTVIKTINIVTQ